jgi:uncharacterized protein YwgA
MIQSREMQPKLTVLNLVLDALGVEPQIETVDDRKRVQKAVYLAQRGGLDLGYRFGWYKLGPYSPKLTEDYYSLAEALEMGESVSSVKFRSPQLGKLKKIRGLFDVPGGVDLSAEDWLELVASVDYLRKISKLQPSEAKQLIKKQKPTLYPFFDQAGERLRHYPLK